MLTFVQYHIAFAAIAATIIAIIITAAATVASSVLTGLSDRKDLLYRIGQSGRVIN